MNASTESLLTIREAAEHCKVKPQTVRSWIAAGHLECVRTPTGRVLTSAQAIGRMFGGKEASAPREQVNQRHKLAMALIKGAMKRGSKEKSK